MHCYHALLISDKSHFGRLCDYKQAGGDLSRRAQVLGVSNPSAFDIGVRRQRALITPMQLDFDLKGGPPTKVREIPKPQEPVVLTVGALTRKVRGLLESGIGDIWVEGEISNLRRQSSGHIYFTLKDESAQLADLFGAADDLSLLAPVTERPAVVETFVASGS